MTGADTPWVMTREEAAMARQLEKHYGFAWAYSYSERGSFPFSAQVRPGIGADCFTAFWARAE